jgi:hypothetical protein
MNDGDFMNPLPIVMEWNSCFLAQGSVITSEVFFFNLDSLLIFNRLFPYIDVIFL